MIYQVNDAYLLDTMIASDAWDKGSPRYSHTRERLQCLDPSPIFVSVISLGEIEFGLKSAPLVDEARQKVVRDNMHEYELLDVDSDTIPIYSHVRAELFKKYAIKNPMGKLLTKQPEELIDAITGKLLGIQENDLWIVCIAIQYNLVFCTREKKLGMRTIIEVANYLDRTQFWDTP